MNDERFNPQNLPLMSAAFVLRAAFVRELTSAESRENRAPELLTIPMT